MNYVLMFRCQNFTTCTAAHVLSMLTSKPPAVAPESVSAVRVTARGIAPGSGSSLHDDTKKAMPGRHSNKHNDRHNDKLGEVKLPPPICFSENILIYQERVIFSLVSYWNSVSSFKKIQLQRYEEKHNAASFFAENMQDTCIFFSLS